MQEVDRILYTLLYKYPLYHTSINPSGQITLYKSCFYRPTRTRPYYLENIQT